MRNSYLNSLLSIFSNWGLSWGGVIDNRRGDWWLMAQVSLILAHLLPPLPSKPITIPDFSHPLTLSGGILCILGAILAFGALISLGKNLSPLPEPKIDSILITKGAYKYCRHPLYQGLIISSIGMSLYLGSFLHFILFILLSLLLVGKAKNEEKRLKTKFSRYCSYMKSTPAILPCLPIFDWRS